MLVDSRTPLIVVAGGAGGVAAIGNTLRGPETVLVRHDLALLGEGVITRTVTRGDDQWLEALELAHGCVSCTLREDVLPLLRRLSARDGVSRIVLLLDPAFEPEAVCRAIDEISVMGIVGRVDAPAGRDVRVEAVITAIDAASWLADAGGDETVAERLVIADDERTVAQVTIGQAEHADAMVVFGSTDPLETARLAAVLARLSPTAAIQWTGDVGPDVESLLESVSGVGHRREFDPHAGLLHGCPPLEADAGVVLVEFEAERPFHPQRLHEAIDTLLDGVITARGRVWLATEPDHVLWLESAGGGLCIGLSDKWIVAIPENDRATVDPDRLAFASLRWDPEFGDRHCALVILVHAADPDEISRALRWALVTDEEWAAPESWQSWSDPFGDWHTDPCENTATPHAPHRGEGEQHA
ncbi:GTP-binding protein [Corynebacteriales bacterium D3-21]|uniref:GTP-binding protein n=1 Tax=Speluncibacter jeojiensis TaxID=2710754 RepID=A0A9X4M201_9ACTN|nr:GTP-binding protein [Corynebacteriales bacterium D3-21]